jgi:hypothetical protein
MAVNRPQRFPLVVSLAQDTFDTWWPCKEAAAYAAKCIGGNHAAASKALWERLRGGMIEAAAGITSVTRPGEAPLSENKPTVVPKILWKNFSSEGSDLWGAGDAKFFISTGAYENGTWVLFVGVRLNPDQVKASLPSPPVPKKEVEQTPAPASLPESPPQKGPSVSDRDLQAWFEVYRSAYNGAADTEDNALASARGMFPGKSVSRDRVRELRGVQRRGRKISDPAK